MPAGKKQDFYQLLGLARDATQDEIKRAYFKAAQRLHPDKNKLTGETEIFLEVQQAYEILSNPKQRAKYDAALPPEEEQAQPLQIKTTYSRANLVRQNETQIIYVLLELVPPHQTDELPAPPLNVCLVLDRSTSMKGEKMDVLKSAAIQVLRSLRPQDMISVITFSDRAEVVIPATQPLEKSKLEARIQMLQPAGATEMFQGLNVGFQEITRNADPSKVNHIILMTDGHTYGDEQKCLKLSERAGKQGVGISAMGIGQEWNDNFLDQIASNTGGSSRYVAQTRDIKSFLLEKFEALAKTYTDDVMLEFECPPGAELSYAFRIRPEVGLLSLESPGHLGPVLQDASLMVLFEFRIDPKLTKEKLLTFLRGSIKIHVSSLGRAQKIPLRFSSPVHREASAEPPPPVIIDALGKLSLYRLQEKARVEAEAGQFELAAQHLNYLATTLLSKDEKELARTVMLEVDHLRAMHTMSEDGQKKIKYGTRSLFLKNEKM
ncbi:MAG: VWA domain-containing protein [Anaerolineales bacterium]